MDKSNAPSNPPKAPHAQCDLCPLVANPMLRGHGPEKARVAIVGSAPTREDVEHGRPLSGTTGQLVNRLLGQQSISREDVYVTNAVLCRTPGDKAPNKKAVRACHDRLIAEVRQAGASVVLALGGEAAQSLLDSKDAISKLRIGGARECDALPGAVVIPTFHPKFSLRNADALPTIASDMDALHPTNVKVGYEPPQYWVCDEPQDAPRWLERQSAFPEVALDIENGIEEGEPNDVRNIDWLCIGIAHEAGRVAVYSERVVRSPQFRETLARIMKEHRTRFIYQNGKYDIQALWEFAAHARVDDDTMLAHYACDERKGVHGLEQLGTAYLNAPNWKSDAKEYLPRQGASYRNIPPDVLHRYNAFDCDVTFRLMEKLREEMKADSVTDVYENFLIPGANALAAVEYEGIHIDLDVLETARQDYAARLEEIEPMLLKWIDNPRSPVQVKKVLAERGFDVPSTNRETLEELEAQTDDEFITLLLQHRDATKFLGTYVEGIQSRMIRGRIHPDFKLHGTETGRLSASNPNIQNQPRRGNIRNMYVARPGYSLVEADYANIEYRLAGALSGDPYICEAFRAGRNLHEEAAREFYGPRYSGKDTDKEKYVTVKTVNFGLLYKETPGHLAHRLHIPFSDARKMEQLFNRRQPVMRAWQRSVEREINEKQYITSLFGRKRRFWLITNENRRDVYKEGCNFMLQSPASDLTLRALIRLTPLLREYGAHVIISVHDALVVETPQGTEMEVARLMKRVMEDNPEVPLPTVIEAKIGQRWGTMKDVDL